VKCVINEAMLNGWGNAFWCLNSFTLSVTAFGIDMSHCLQEFRLCMLTFQATSCRNFCDLLSSVLAFNNSGSESHDCVFC
jgi:hypothetical protein